MMMMMRYCGDVGSCEAVVGSVDGGDDDKVVLVGLIVVGLIGVGLVGLVGSVGLLRVGKIIIVRKVRKIT